MNRCLVLVVALCAPAAVFGSFSYAIVGELHAMEADCAGKTGATFDNIELARKNLVLPADQNMGDFAKCMLEKFNVMRPDGSVNQNPEEYTIPADTNGVLLSAVECKVLVGQDAAETARKVMNCFLKDNQMVLAYEARGTKFMA